MDVSRAVLDNLMGRDRNKPNDLITERDHYSNPDVSLFINKRYASHFWFVSVLIRCSLIQPMMRGPVKRDMILT
jgi:hypothetical protein